MTRGESGVFAIFCTDCGADRGDPRTFPPDPEDRPICAACGSIEVTSDVRAFDSATVQIHEQVAYKHRGPNNERIAEGKVGSEWFRIGQRWHRVERHIDKANDWYDEVVTDEETGDVVREVHEPLSEHWGRGDAKRT